MTTESRLEQVEGELAQVTARLHRLEAEMEIEAEMPRAPSPPPTHARPAPRGRAAARDRSASQGRPASHDRSASPMRPLDAERRESLLWPTRGEPELRPTRTAFDLEALLGGQVLAWIGGLAILFGAVLFLGMAISRGWLGEEARTIIAAAISLAALLGGVWLHERRGRTEAARALVASAISGLFGTIVVATQAYSLISPQLGLVLGAAVAAVGFAIAVRWRSPIVAAVGSLGALASPALLGLGGDGLSVAFVALALAASVGILVWQRWDWLALGAFLVSAPQLLAWAGDQGRAHLVLAVAVLAGFWLLYAAAALGYELRRRTEEVLPVASWFLLLGSCLTFVWPGYWLLHQAHHQTAAVVLLFAFAALQVGLGVLAIRLRVHRELGSLLVGLGIAIAAFGLGAAFHGPALVVAWAASAAALAALASRLDATPSPALSSAERITVGAACFLVLAVGHTLLFEAHPSAIFDGVESLAEAAVAIGACALAALAVARFARRVSPEAAQLAAFTGAALLVYLGSIVIVDTVGVDRFGGTRQAGQTWLSAFWTVTGLGAVIFGLVRRQAEVRLAGLALLGVAIAKVWIYDLAELEALARVLSFVGLGALLLVGSFAYGRIKPEAPSAPAGNDDTGGQR
jgi:uncharacterized membrane protein